MAPSWAIARSGAQGVRTALAAGGPSATRRKGGTSVIVGSRESRRPVMMAPDERRGERSIWRAPARRPDPARPWALDRWGRRFEALGPRSAAARKLNDRREPRAEATVICRTVPPYYVVQDS